MSLSLLYKPAVNGVRAFGGLGVEEGMRGEKWWGEGRRIRHRRGRVVGAGWMKTREEEEVSERRKDRGEKEGETVGGSRREGKKR